jgi:hypothetical protein
MRIFRVAFYPKNNKVIWANEIKRGIKELSKKAVFFHNIFRSGMFILP